MAASSPSASVEKGPPAGSLAAAAALARWQNALIAAGGVALGAWWTGGHLADRPVVLAMIAALALAAFANVTNDVHDIEIDRVAHPERPLPRGLLTEHAAWWLAAASACVALLASTLATPWLGVLTVGVLGTMFAYSRWIKRLGLPGNVVVAVVASLPFLYGGVAAGAMRASLGLVALAIPLHLAREVAKDLDDAVGDSPARRTLPVAYGPAAARVALVVALLAFVAVLIPWVVRWPRLGALVAPALVLCALGARRSISGRPGAPARFKAAMILAMLSLVALRALPDLLTSVFVR